MGKNAVFVLETLQQLDVDEGLSRVLVSCHTKELAFQISKKYEGFDDEPEDERFCKYMPSMKVSVFYEGVPLKNDIVTINNGKPQKYFADETPRWRSKMAAAIFEFQSTGQGAQKDSPNCSWAPNWGRGPDPDPIRVIVHIQMKC